MVLIAGDLCRMLKVDIAFNEVMDVNYREVFPKAPITEALLDILVELPSTTNLEVLSSFQESIKEQYPLKRDKIMWQGGLQIQEGGVPQICVPTGGPVGYFFESPEHKKIVQARLDGFTFSKLKPYDKWEIFVEEARSLWYHYGNIAKPLMIKRIGLRYINRIEMPFPVKDFKEYILTVPEIAPGIPQQLFDFFVRLVIPFPEQDIVGIITETAEALQPGSKYLAFIFDIDVFQASSIAINEDFWAVVERLHECKNQIFFNSITNKTKELFK